MATKIGQRRKAHLYIKEWMEHRGLSDEKVAGRVGVARETIFRWHTEPKRLNPEKIAQLAEALDMEPQEFYRPPGRPSLDAMVQNVPDELQRMVADVVARMVGKAS